MSSPDPPDAAWQVRLDEAIASYLRRVDAGEPVDRARFLADHPDLVDDLRDFLETSDEFAIFEPPPRDDRTPPFAALTDPLRPRPRATLGVGRVFGGYELLGELGHGGMGVVYEARQAKPGRVVALKMLLAVRLLSDGDVQRFRTEAEAAAALDHPNIVPIYDVGEASLEGIGPPVPYFSMKRLSGGTLAQWREAEHRVPANAARVVATVARAVHHAHQRGILHRDLKPANILLDENGVPHVVDFGLARRLEVGSDLTRTGEILGTPAYMAPEQAAGGKGAVTVATDVWGLGAILYDLLSGRAPFQAETPLEALVRVRDHDPAPPSQAAPGVPTDLETICLKCLQKDPGQRYTSAEALAEDLDRWQRGEPIAARRAGVWERLVKGVRRRPGLSALAALSLLLAGVGVGGVTAAYLEAAAALRETSVALEKKEVAEKQANKLLEEKSEALAAEAAARGRAEALLFDHRLLLAELEWRGGRVARARQVLNDCRPAAFRWDWGYLDRLCSSELSTYRAHAVPITGLTFGPDGREIAEAALDGMVRLWDVAGGRRPAQLPCGRPMAGGSLSGHGQSTVAYSRDGQRLACACGDAVHLWNMASRTRLGTFRRPNTTFLSTALSADGRRLAGGGLHLEEGRRPTLEVTAWDTESGEVLWSQVGREDGWCVVVLLPDGRKLVYGGAANPVTIVDLDEKRPVTTLRRGGVPVTPRAMALQADGRQLAIAHRDRTLSVWDATAAAPAGPVQTLPGSAEETLALAISPDGHLLAAGGLDDMIHLWDIKKGVVLRTLRGHENDVSGLAFSPDGGRLASASRDGTVKVWDPHRSPEGRPFPGVGTWVRHWTFNADHTHYAAAALRDGSLFVGDATGGPPRRLTAPPGKEVAALALDSMGQRLAVVLKGEPAVTIWDVAATRPAFTLTGARRATQAVALSPDGRTLATAGEDREVCLWSATDGSALRTVGEHAGAVARLTFSPDGKRLAAADAGREVRVWDLEENRAPLTLTAPRERIEQLAFTPDSRHLTAAIDARPGIVCVWDAATGALVHHLAGHPVGVVTVTAAPDGRCLASGGRDGSVKIWDLETGQEVLGLTGASGCVLHLAFAPNGHRLVGILHQKTDHLVWDATPQEAPR